MTPNPPAGGYTMVRWAGTIQLGDGAIDPMAYPALLVLVGMGRRIVIELPYPKNSGYWAKASQALNQSGIFALCSAIVQSERELLDLGQNISVYEILDARAVGWPGWSRLPDLLAGRPGACLACENHKARAGQAAADLARAENDLLAEAFKIQSDNMRIATAGSLIAAALAALDQAPSPTSEVLFGADPNGSQGKYLDPELAGSIMAALQSAIANTNLSHAPLKAIKALSGIRNQLTP